MPLYDYWHNMTAVAGLKIIIRPSVRSLKGLADGFSQDQPRVVAVMQRRSYSAVTYHLLPIFI
jgi:hypothetical protein